MVLQQSVYGDGIKLNRAAIIICFLNPRTPLLGLGDIENINNQSVLPLAAGLTVRKGKNKNPRRRVPAVLIIPSNYRTPHVKINNSPIRRAVVSPSCGRFSIMRPPSWSYGHSCPEESFFAEQAEEPRPSAIHNGCGHQLIVR